VVNQFGGLYFAAKADIDKDRLAVADLGKIEEAPVDRPRLGKNVLPAQAVAGGEDFSA
jgi:hypothetical protein